jgi:hypothetical protein
LKNKFFNAETQRREGKTSETVIQKIFDELPVPGGEGKIHQPPRLPAEAGEFFEWLGKLFNAWG